MNCTLRRTLVMVVVVADWSLLYLPYLNNYTCACCCHATTLRRPFIPQLNQSDHHNPR